MKILGVSHWCGLTASAQVSDSFAPPCTNGVWGMAPSAPC